MGGATMSILKIFGSVAGGWQAIVIYGLLAAGVLAGAAGWGYMQGMENLYEYQGKQAVQAVNIVVKQGEVTERVIVRYVKVKGETRTVTQTVEKEVIKYVEKNTGNCLDSEWGLLHDAAAANTVSTPPGRADGASGAPTAAEALQAVTDSYAACHRTADRLDALQAWVRDQAKVAP
jgi:hypothetical protein